MSWIHIATVSVPADVKFPVDMLRYDMCWPMDSDAVNAIALGPLDHAVKVDVMARTDHRDQRAFTPDRWASFGVRIVNIETKRTS